jgi:hypothetical protein
MLTLELTPDTEILPGYRLTRFIGRGGFGQVWEIEAPGGILKAAKVVPLTVSTDETWRLRELDGLQKVRQIRHPYLLSVERFEIIDGSLIIITELAESNLGYRFKECAGRGMPGIPRKELIRYMREAAEVLDLLGDKHGLAHLDIKPDNLFLNAGHLKVGDFSLVHPRGVNLSRQSLAITPPYAAPELFDGTVDATADQYALAVTWQELLTGTRPYDGDLREIITQLVKGRPNMAHVPAADYPILLKALHRDPRQRFPNCQAMIAELAKVDPDGASARVPTGGGQVRNGPEWKVTGGLTGALTDVRTTAPRADREQPQRMFARRGKNAATITQQVTAKIDMPVGGPMAPVSEPAAPLTSPADLKTRSIEPAERVMARCAHTVKVSFLAFIPPSIYAHKLRGFMLGMKAEMLEVDEERVLLRMRTRGWFNRSSGPDFLIDIRHATRDAEAGFCLVEATIGTSMSDLPEQEVARRALLLMQALRAYLMVVEHDVEHFVYHDDQVRNAVLAKPAAAAPGPKMTKRETAGAN